MASLNGFDANNVQPNAGFDPVPPGKYLCVVCESEMKPTKNGAGEYLQLELEIVEGEHKGRKIWDRLVLRHQSEQTVRIAKGTLSALCRAVNVMAPRDSVELHNIPVLVSLGCKRREDNGELTNYIRGYSKRGAPTPVAAATAPGGRAPATAGAGGGVVSGVGGVGSPPWKR